MEEKVSAQLCSPDTRLVTWFCPQIWMALKSPGFSKSSSSCWAHPVMLRGAHRHAAGWVMMKGDLHVSSHPPL